MSGVHNIQDGDLLIIGIELNGSSPETMKLFIEQVRAGFLDALGVSVKVMCVNSPGMFEVLRV